MSTPSSSVSEGTRPEVSILIVSYNTIDLTRACLRSIFEQTKEMSFEVVVVDNSSEDNTSHMIATEFPQVRLIPSKTNHGFARGNNIAAGKAQGEWLLLLNPDTVVLDQAIEKLVAFAKAHPQAAIFGGRTLDADGELNPTSCWARPTLWSMFARACGISLLLGRFGIFDPEAMKGWDRSTTREVDIITGCFLLLRRRHWDLLGGFDPAFFLYGEEADLCLRASRAGLKCLFCPNAQIIHYGGRSSQTAHDKIIRGFRSRSILFQKHWTVLEAFLGRLCLDLCATTRWLSYSVLYVATGRHGDKAKTWALVLKARRDWHDVRHDGVVDRFQPSLTE